MTCREVNYYLLLLDVESSDAVVSGMDQNVVAMLVSNTVDDVHSVPQDLGVRDRPLPSQGDALVIVTLG